MAISNGDFQRRFPSSRTTNQVPSERRLGVIQLMPSPITSSSPAHHISIEGQVWREVWRNLLLRNMDYLISEAQAE